MKHLMIFVALLIGLSVSAQTFTEKATGFNVEEGMATGNIITVQGETFDLYKTDSGALYVIAISKKDTKYPSWIGRKTTSLFDDKDVYVTKNGNYCYYKLTNKGYPYPVWLKKD